MDGILCGSDLIAVIGLGQGAGLTRGIGTGLVQGETGGWGAAAGQGGRSQEQLLLAGRAGSENRLQGPAQVRVRKLARRPPQLSWLGDKPNDYMIVLRSGEEGGLWVEVEGDVGEGRGYKSSGMASSRARSRR